MAEGWRWFTEGRLGLFIHWGPYACIGRGEQVLFREHMEQKAYADMACAWNPRFYDPRLWAATARDAGFRYACLTTRHHDGFCLWDTATTDYSSARQAAQRDFVADYVAAFRAEGLRVGLYYSLMDWRIPAYFEPPDRDPAAWAAMRDYIHAQVRELLTRYGRIDYLFFDGLWPRTTEDIAGRELLQMIRELQPDIIVNDRLGTPAGETLPLGDVGTPEHHITVTGKLWESCQVTTWRLWGYAAGERWRSPAQWLDMLGQCAAMGGNLLLNVGPDGEGRLPAAFLDGAGELGRWMRLHGEAIRGEGGGNLTEFTTWGWQTVRGNRLYLIFRFWPGTTSMRLPDLESTVLAADLITTGQPLSIDQQPGELHLGNLPIERPTSLFPVIRLTCAESPRAGQWGRERLWGGDPARVAEWARTRGESVWRDGASTTSTEGAHHD